MENLSGRQESNTSSSLDNEYITARKRYRRMYHRVMSGLERKGNVRLITLTSAPGSGDFQKDFRKLAMRLIRRKILVSYIRCPELTESGLRHDHILYRGSYLDQAYLSKLWGKIHNSPVVDIRRTGHRRRLACYLASYVAKSPAGRYSYSWGWVWRGFAKSWERLKRYGYEMGYSFNQVLTIWRWHIKLGIKVEEVIPI